LRVSLAGGGGYGAYFLVRRIAVHAVVCGPLRSAGLWQSRDIWACSCGRKGGGGVTALCTRHPCYNCANPLSNHHKLSKQPSSRVRSHSVTFLAPRKAPRSRAPRQGPPSNRTRVNNIMKVEIMGYARESGVILIIEPLSIRYSSHAITRRPLANTECTSAHTSLRPPPPPGSHSPTTATTIGPRMLRCPRSSHLSA
jgi:hypothetical protein